MRDDSGRLHKILGTQQGGLVKPSLMRAARVKEMGHVKYEWVDTDNSGGIGEPTSGAVCWRWSFERVRPCCSSLGNTAPGDRQTHSVMGRHGERLFNMPCRA